jgi:hypothetical protein
MAQYELKHGQWLWSEQHLYGAERLGVDHVLDSVWTDSTWVGVTVYDYACQCYVSDGSEALTLQHHVRYARSKKYELTNHLGNVMVVVSDMAIASAATNFLLPDVVSATDYYPFGLEMVGRTYISHAYSFSFNTQMKSPEILPGHTTAMYWEYDARIGRRWELDPKTFIGWSGYVCLGDSPIGFNDILGDKWKNTADVAKAEDLTTKLKDVREIKNNDKNRLQKKMDRALRKGNDKKFLELAKQKRELSEEISYLDMSINNIAKMGSLSEPQVFTFDAITSIVGETYMNTSREIVIEFNSDANAIHELNHGAQYLSLDLTYLPLGKGHAKALDLHDEVECYRAQFAFDKTSMPNLPSSILEINIQYVMGIKVQGKPLYYDLMYRKENRFAGQKMNPVYSENDKAMSLFPYPRVKASHHE